MRGCLFLYRFGHGGCSLPTTREYRLLFTARRHTDVAVKRYKELAIRRIVAHPICDYAFEKSVGNVIPFARRYWFCPNVASVGLATWRKHVDRQFCSRLVAMSYCSAADVSSVVRNPIGAALAKPCNMALLKHSSQSRMFAGWRPRRILFWRNVGTSMLQKQVDLGPISRCWRTFGRRPKNRMELITDMVNRQVIERAETDADHFVNSLTLQDSLVMWMRHVCKGSTDWYDAPKSTR